MGEIIAGAIIMLVGTVFGFGLAVAAKTPPPSDDA